MACSIDKIKADALTSFLNEVAGPTMGKSKLKFDSNGVMTFNFGPDRKMQKEENAYEARERIIEKLEPAIEAWATEKLKSEVLGKEKFLETSLGHERMFLKFKFPTKVERAFEARDRKRAEEARMENERMEERLELLKHEQEIKAENIRIQEEVAKQLAAKPEGSQVHFASPYKSTEAFEDAYYKQLDEQQTGLEEFDDEDFDMAITNITTVNHEDYIKHKEKYLNKLEKAHHRLVNQRKVKKNNTKALNTKIGKLTQEIDKLTKELDTFSKSQDKDKDLFIMINQDFNKIDELLKDKSLENLMMAKYLLNYIKNVSDTRRDNEKYNKLFPVAYMVSTQSPKIFDKINEANIAFDEVSDEIFLGLLENSAFKDNLLKLHPGKNLEQIKAEILADSKDINSIESWLFDTGSNVATPNNVIENLLRLEYQIKLDEANAISQKLIQRIDAMLPDVEREMKKLGFQVNSSLGTLVYKGFNYTKLFYQHESGNPKPYLIRKFNNSWDKTWGNITKRYNEQLFKARQSNDADKWAQVDKLLTNKFNELDNISDFGNLGLMHDLYADPKYAEFQSGTPAEAAAYRKQLVDQIGEAEYETILEKQRGLLDDYFNEVENIQNYFMSRAGVTDVNQLPADVKANMDISIARNNPATFYNHYATDGNSDLVFQSGTQKFTKPAYLKFNVNIPKKETKLGDDTGFYNKDFEKIEQNPILLQFWGVLRDAARTVNENLVHSELNITQNTILYHKKQFVEESVNRRAKDIFAEFFRIDKHVHKAVKGMLSDKKIEKDSETQDVKLSGELGTFESQVSEDFAILKTELSNIFDRQATNGMMIDLTTLTQQQSEDLMKALGVASLQEVVSEVRAISFPVEDLKIYSEKKIMEQQSFDLPRMMKAFLELSAEHKARTDFLDHSNLYQQISDRIKVGTSNLTRQIAGRERTNEQKRMRFFHDKVVANDTTKNHGASFSKWAEEEYGRDNRKHFFFKNYTPDEKVIYNSAVTRIKSIDKLLVSASVTAKQKEELAEERERLDKRLRLLGKDYMWTAVWDNFVNKLAVSTGLKYNFLANFKNRMQGHIALLTRDGEFWPEGAIYPVEHFVTLSLTKGVRPGYKKELKKADLFAKQLKLIIDGTNENQEAKSAFTGGMEVLSPMYGTKVVEYKNQLTGLLCMATAIKIKGKDGTVVPLFSGNNFPAHEIRDGVLRLTANFDTPENREAFEEFTGPEMAMKKAHMAEMINNLNGDYSKTGITRIKGNLFLKPIMLFKTWLTRYITSRYRWKQKNILTGNVETGYMLSSLTNRKTSLLGGAMVGSTAAVGMLASMSPLIGGTIAAAALGYGVFRSFGRKPNADGSITEPLAVMAQVGYAMKMINPLRAAEMPINLILGKQVIKPVAFKPEHGLTKQEQTDIRLLAKNLQHTVLLAAIKIMIQAFFQDHEEDEPKGDGGPESDQYKRWQAQQQRRDEERARNNFLENLFTGFFQETALALEPTSVGAMFGSKNSVESSFDKVGKIGVAMGAAVMGYDEISKGERMGQSKLGNTVRKTFIPALFRDLGQGTYMGGLETITEREWETNEFVDKWFETDYKLAKKEATETRAERKQRVNQEFEEKTGKKPYMANEEELKELKEQYKVPSTDREDYDEKQMLKNKE